MIDHHPPPLESPYSPGAWSQPDRTQVLIDETHALMTKATFEKLLEYSSTTPTGVYPGKMWRRRESEWLFCWYGPTADPAKCLIHFRYVLLV